MKNPAQERFRIQMKQYHRNHPWRLDGGLFIPHAYPEPLKVLSWWDDVGFVLNGRRVMVWWVHPRMKYADTISDMAWEEAGAPPLRGTGMFDSSEKEWKKVGRSRKKVVAYRTHPLPDSQREYYAKLRAIEMRLESSGIDRVERPSMSVKSLPWCTGLDLCAPIEVRDKEGIGALAALARRLIKSETTLADEFPGYQYSQENWLSEANVRNQDRPQEDSE